jgi:hypothetical protein
VTLLFLTLAAVHLAYLFAVQRRMGHDRGALDDYFAQNLRVNGRFIWQMRGFR